MKFTLLKQCRVFIKQCRVFIKEVNYFINANYTYINKVWVNVMTPLMADLEPQT